MSKNRFAGPAIAIIIVVLFVVWMASGSDDNQAQLNANPQPAKSLIATVQVVPSESRWVNQSLKINGITEAKRSVTVRSEANGKVVRLLKEQGQIVKKGDVIAELDQQDIPARLKQAKAFVEQTRLEYEGAQRLKGQGLQNEVQLAGALTNYEQAKAQLAGLELQQANTAIRAPFNGQIENLNLELGSFVRQGDAIADVYDYCRTKHVGCSVKELDAEEFTKYACI
ncbi:MAG: efflux RND transporter periplasmic adaptor subunit, partial [Reinekea sp.]|nr:efflux RND transporter periplasmic adaptor subunit [Reinekea sp.]